ncbi:MAG: hypothetical protein IJ640_00735 [Prevotella sp.]|nr:hypothetical protein [Prevotella sp.]
MKAEELMIGDWVNVAEFGIIDQIMTFTPDTAITGHGYTCGEYEYDRLAPIPLTPDILKKNGFVYKDLPFENFYEGYGLCIHGGNFADGSSIWYITCGTNVCMNVNHVHELQHALRLCGITHTIEI